MKTENKIRLLTLSREIGRGVISKIKTDLFDQGAYGISSHCVIQNNGDCPDILASCDKCPFAILQIVAFRDLLSSIFPHSDFDILSSVTQIPACNILRAELKNGSRGFSASLINTSSGGKGDVNLFIREK